MAFLSVRDLSIQFGGLKAVERFSVDVEQGRIHSLIGPNGAGKTSIINTITGLYPATSGSVCLDGEELLGRAPHQIARRGVTRTFQNIELFREMTVLDNILVGAHQKLRYGVLGATLRVGGAWAGERHQVQRAEQMLEMLGLVEDRDQQAGDLPVAKQRRLELARALASEPRLLLLDEPGAGMAAAEVAGLNKMLLDLRERRGLTILLVDHVMQVVMNISDVVTVLHYGEKIAEGTAETIQTHPDVIRAYLGERRSRADR